MVENPPVPTRLRHEDPENLAITTFISWIVTSLISTFSTFVSSPWLVSLLACTPYEVWQVAFSIRHGSQQTGICSKVETIMSSNIPKSHRD